MADELKELRQQFDYDVNQWREIRKQGATDMLCVAGSIWEALDPRGYAARRAKNRPALSFDELSQYVNTLINEIRQNKRAIKVTAMPPLGNQRPARELEAEARFRANLIRQIEYRSNATRDAYTVMFENTVQRSYGSCRIVPAYVSDETDAQELLIKPIWNPDQLTPDGDAQAPDGSDMRHCWYVEWWSESAFTASFPKAKTQGMFERAMGWLAPSTAWVGDGRILVAEYWCQKGGEFDRLVALKPTDASAGELRLALHSRLTADGLPEGYEYARDVRQVEKKRVVKQLTNGYDVLEETSWPGRDIPFVLCLGKVLYISQEGKSERVIHSLHRLARDPAMLLSYYRTSEAELVGLTPKFPYFIRRGSLKPDQLRLLEKSVSEPVPVIQVEGSADGLVGQPPELPVRNPWEPPIQALEIGAESARRAVQTATGTNFLPTDAQNRNQKSGKALEKIRSAAQQGSYHFVDHFEGSIARVGVILNDLLDKYYDTARDVTVRKPDLEPEIVRINDPQDQNAIHLTPGGQFDVTISTGPSFESEREAASDFADTLAGIGPQVFSLLGDLIVKLKNLGPIGDEMAERLVALQPPEVRALSQAKNDPQRAAAELLATKQELQKLQMAATEMQRAIETEAAKQQAALQRASMDRETAEYKARLDKETALELERLKAATAIRIAEINASVKGYAEEAKHAAAHEAQALGLAFDADQAAIDRDHQAAMAERAHEQALEQGERETAADAMLQDRQAASDMAMQEQAGAQQERLAMMQPPPGSDNGAGA